MAEAIPGSTLIKNSQCQEYVSVIQPPATGPTVGASTAKTPASMVATPWRRTGNSRKTAENTAGISVPPKNPCATRQATSVAKPSLPAQPAEATVNNDTADTNNRRMPNSRVKNPVNGMAMTSAIK